MLYEHKPSEGSLESYGRPASSFHVDISLDKHLRPHFLPPLLTRALYRDLQRKVLPELLLDVNLQTRLHLRSTQDDDAPRFLLAVREI